MLYDEMRLKFIGMFFVVAGIMCLLSGLMSPVSANNIKTGACEGDYNVVANDIIKKNKPEAHAKDKGVHYMKYSNAIITVSQKGDTNCFVAKENLSRYRSGGFIYLGPGFRPSSPSSSSGGSSGSYGGTK